MVFKRNLFFQVIAKKFFIATLEPKQQDDSKAKNLTLEAIHRREDGGDERKHEEHPEEKEEVCHQKVLNKSNEDDITVEKIRACSM